MKRPSLSRFIKVRGLDYHCRVWGTAANPLLVLLHGWMDVSASFQFLVDALQGDWHVVAPDWRGFGLTAWSGADAYWFPDYVGDLDALLHVFSPERPVLLCGHSMGGNIACMYAGIRPQRVHRLINLEGFGLADAAAAGAPRRYARWLADLQEPQRFRDYAGFAELADRLQRNNPRLTAERAAFLSQHWGEQTLDGRVRLRSDPAHKRVNPIQYRLDEARACWEAVTAPVLWVEGEDSSSARQLHLTSEDLAIRRRCFGNARFVVIPQAGHMLHLDQPEALAHAMEDFLRVAG